MGCDTLIGTPNEEGITPPCVAGLVNVPRKEMKVLVVHGPLDPKIVDKTLVLAEEKGATAIEFKAGREGSITTYIINRIPLGHILREEVVESGVVDNARYEIVRVEMVDCTRCPLNTPGRLIGVFAPPCSIRTSAYSDIVPTIEKGIVHDISVIDTLIEEAERYKPRDEYDSERRLVLLKWLRNVKKYLGGKEDVVLFNWC